jgi:uncharacterized protein YbbC (DUF1343 family)
MSSNPTKTNRFLPGIETLLHGRHGHLLQGRRIGLVSHLAAVDRTGTTTAGRLHETPGITLACLMGPEHGFFGFAAAGVTCRSQRHPDWRIPIYSLYGDTRKPRPQWLRSLDLLIIDLQDLGCRPYTYVSTLKLVLEAAAEAGLPVLVADRPIPLPRTVDGPMLDPCFESFVSAINAPMVYGMTPAETARWLQQTCIPQVDLQIAPLQGYRRDIAPLTDAPPFMRPSPSIVSRESALCFPATVCLEGLPQIDHGRQTAMPFQLVGAPWTRGEPLAETLNGSLLPGIIFHPHHYQPPGAKHPISGVRLTVTNAGTFRPVLTGITILAALAAHHGKPRVWNHRKTRADFFDKLMGTDTVRLALMAGTPPSEIAESWKAGQRRFKQQRNTCLLYQPARDLQNPSTWPPTSGHGEGATLK